MFVLLAYEVEYDEEKRRSNASMNGVAGFAELSRLTKVGVFNKLLLECSLLNHACNRTVYARVPLYDTLGTTFTSSRTTRPQFEPVTPEQRYQVTGKNLVLKSHADIELLDKAYRLPADPPLPPDVSTLCCAPVTTGDSKSVVLLHSNFVIFGVLAQERLAIDPTDMHLSYLPLSHVFEHMTHAALMRSGASIDIYKSDVLFHIEDLAKLVSTIFASVPRLFNRVYDKISNYVAAAGGLKRLLFDQAYAIKKAALSDDVKTHARRAAGTCAVNYMLITKKP